MQAFDFTFTRQIQNPVPNLKHGTFLPTLSPEKTEDAARIISAYHHSQRDLKESGDEAEANLAYQTKDDLWTRILEQNLSQLVDALEAGDERGLVKILDRFGHSYTRFGGVSLGIDGYTHWNQKPEYVAYSYHDKLVRLAEAVGTLGVESPEHGPMGDWGNNQNIAPDDLCAQLEKVLGFELGIKQNGLPVFGIMVGSGLLHYRHLNAAYGAFRLKQILRTCCLDTQQKPEIAEHGGGLGLVAYYMSLTDLKSYWLFDLPVTNAISAWFLLNCAHPIKVSLYGEAASNADGTVIIHPSWRCSDLADATISVSLNIDSMPEMSSGIVQAFKSEIRRSTSEFFLNINQEHMLPFSKGGARHNRVFDIFGAGTGFELLSRYPYWMRPGYVEELWKPD